MRLFNLQGSGRVLFTILWNRGSLAGFGNLLCWGLCICLVRQFLPWRNQVTMRQERRKKSWKPQGVAEGVGPALYPPNSPAFQHERPGPASVRDAALPATARFSIAFILLPKVTRRIYWISHCMCRIDTQRSCAEWVFSPWVPVSSAAGNADYISQIAPDAKTHLLKITPGSVIWCFEEGS